MPARVVLGLGAIAAIVLLALSLRAHDACDAARADVFGVALGRQPRSDEAPALQTIRDSCRGTAALTAASAALQRQGRDREARALALRATRAEPDSATAWNALAIAARQTDPALARRAARRAVALSPLDPPPVPLRSPAPAPAASGSGGGP